MFSMVCIFETIQNKIIFEQVIWPDINTIVIILGNNRRLLFLKIPTEAGFV